MSVKKIPAQEAKVEVTITMTEAEYEAISTNSMWGGNGSVEEYMKQAALGHRNRGC